MQRWLFIFFSILKVLTFADELDFDVLMGKGDKVWTLLSESDKSTLSKFKSHFLKYQKGEKKLQDIPKKLHFIWLGPKDFPKESYKNLFSWIEKHPTWEVFLWSDRARPSLHQRLQINQVEDFSFLFLKDLYALSDNWGEKSDLLRYELLYQIGGIYIDHDVICFRPFDDIVSQTDLFCGLEFPHKPLADTALNVCNNLIGAAPLHPILLETMKWCQEKSPIYKAIFSLKDADSVTQRIYHTSFAAFDQAVKKLVFTENYANKVFPAGFFNKLGKKFGIFSHHFYQSTWFESEAPFEKNVRQRLVKICKKHNQALMISTLSFLLLSFVSSFIFFQIRAIKKSLEEIKKGFINK